MDYVALLRGINVGGNRKVEMPRLKKLFETMGYTKVSTYINTGNVLFSGKADEKKIVEEMKREFGFEIPTLIKTVSEMQKIAQAIPQNWTNDSEQKSDVAYLFKEKDSKEIIDELPIKKEFVTLKYVKGALLINVKRDDLNKSQLNKLVGSKLYSFMTLRNVNTARKLAE